jgi:hypothetical protein
MKKYGTVEVQLHAILTSALNGGMCSASCPGCFTPAERAPSTQWLGGQVAPRLVWKWWQRGKNPFPVPVRNWTPVVQPAAQSLYWLSYLGSPYIMLIDIFRHLTEQYVIYMSSIHLQTTAILFVGLRMSMYLRKLIKAHVGRSTQQWANTTLLRIMRNKNEHTEQFLTSRNYNLVTTWIFKVGATLESSNI